MIPIHVLFIQSIASLPSIDTRRFPICQTKDQYECGEKVATKVWYDTIKNGTCPHACTTFQYTGSIVKEKFYRQDSLKEVYLLKIYYFYDSPVSVTVFEEYLIYDMASLIGSVGGTLGMCIGFSFTGLISMILNQVLKLVKE